MKKLNNKGFSLVELIIVIAIMAILVGVVGTQVIPYLENSRKAKDNQIFSAWNTAAVSAYSTEAGNLDSTAIYTITVSSSADVAVTSSNTPAKGVTNLKDTFKSLTNLSGAYTFSTEMASKAGKSVSSVVITIDGGDGSVTTHINAGAGYSFDDIENK